ncbi:alginate export family protein [Ectopseudomonas oleovorans]|uniref:Alginate export family protein n=1 Tax=Ectopseudomonas oleovorans TaxID=301 RepID=A0AA42Q6N9_ECTOL|nr:alginate export family protein [Pseudomonas oleovorans]MDH1338065.1 alginate export family protein [Pseudomonas oleovorans]MDH1494073.1 alginate export family protein [Pseudomonas oleovorans]WGG20000.1 alginate export family protein [Pseudomonas oleovorans]
MRANPLLLCPLLLASTVPAVAQAEEALANLFTQGKPILDLRYRYEHVDQDNALDPANAQTLRTRAGLQTGRWHGFSGLLEVDNVSRIGDERFNDTRNGRGNYSVVGDPDGTEINQALLRYDHARGSAVAGRQRIELDNQRFVGGVAWRQNEQTYDGFLGQLKPLDQLTLTYAYLDTINTPFGPDGQHGYPTNPANIEGHSHLFNLAHAWRPELKVTAYSYLLGLDNLAVAPTAAPGSQSSRTSGLRLTGTREGFSYALEYARQRDYGNNPLDLNGHYFLGELAYQHGGYLAKAGYEVLGGAQGPGNRAFQTPLATKHLFQGWADLFLITPAAGIRDSYVGGSLPLLGGSLQAWYHDFRADRGGDSYGQELDVAYSRPIPHVKNLVAMAKYARYAADEFAVDTDKFWVQLQYRY